MIKIAVDAMGGDYAPEEIIKGAIMAAQKGDVELLLVGPVKKLLSQMMSFTAITKNESDGGDLLWGVNGAVHLLHGNSKAHQVNKTIAKAKHAVEIGLIASLRTELTTFGSELPPTG